MVTEQTIEAFINSAIAVDVFLGTENDRALEAPEMAKPDDHFGFEIAVITNGKGVPKRVLYCGTGIGYSVMEHYVTQTFPGERIVGTWKCEIVDGQRGWRYYSAKGVGA
jgi:hypothetical protein